MELIGQNLGDQLFHSLYWVICVIQGSLQRDSTYFTLIVSHTSFIHLFSLLSSHWLLILCCVIP